MSVKRKNDSEISEEESTSSKKSKVSSVDIVSDNNQAVLDTPSYDDHNYRALCEDTLLIDGCTGKRQETISARRSVILLKNNMGGGDKCKESNDYLDVRGMQSAPICNPSQCASSCPSGPIKHIDLSTKISYTQTKDLDLTVPKIDLSRIPKEMPTKNGVKFKKDMTSRYDGLRLCTDVSIKQVIPQEIDSELYRS